MKEKLLKLIDLQNIDTKIVGIKKNLEKAPMELEKLLEESSPHTEKYNKDANLLKEKESKNLKYKMELEEKTDNLKSLQMRLSNVKNAKELSAVDTEINAVKKNIGEIEEKSIKLLDEIDDLKKEISEEEQIIKEEKKNIGELEIKIGKEKQATSGEIDSLEKERKKIADQIPEELLEKYEFIFEKRESKAIVAVKDSVCTGCYMSVPPQMVNDIKKGLKIFYCQYCSRMLFYPEWEN